MSDNRTPQAHVPRALVVAGTYGWRILVVAGAFYVIAWALTQLFVVVVPLILSLFIAAAVQPIVDRLRRWGVPSALATAAVFVVLLCIVGLLGFWLTTRVRGQFDDLGQQVRQGIGQIEQWLIAGPPNLDPERVSRLEEQITSLQATSGGLAGRIVGRARQLIELLAGVVLMFFATFFLLKDGPDIGAWIRERVDVAYRDDLTAIASRVVQVMRWYLVGTMAVGLVDATLIAVALIVLDVPLVLPLTVLTFASAFFPVVGAFVAGTLAALVALVSGGFQTALLVVAATIVVQQIEGNLLQPLIMANAVRLHPLVTVSVVSAGLIAAGLVGAFLAVPVTAMTARIVGYYHLRRGQVPVSAQAA